MHSTQDHINQLETSTMTKLEEKPTATTQVPSASLPDVKDWPHRPCLVTNTSNTVKLASLLDGDEKKIGTPLSTNQAVPLGVPIAIESSLFKGQMIIRLRNAASDNPTDHKTYFEGRKRLFSVTYQGRFKKTVAMDDLNFGSMYTQPMKKRPSKFLMGALQGLFRIVNPGLIVDLRSDHPRVMGLLAGMMQSIRMDKPGEEPDIATLLDVEENLLQTLEGSSSRGQEADSKKRKNKFSVPSKASKYSFDTEHVYTFDQYDHMMDLPNMNMHLPGNNIVDMTETSGEQPVSLCAVRTSTGERIFDVTFWHEKILPEK